MEANAAEEEEEAECFEIHSEEEKEEEGEIKEEGVNSSNFEEVPLSEEPRVHKPRGRPVLPLSKVEQNPATGPPVVVDKAIYA